MISSMTRTSTTGPILIEEYLEKSIERVNIKPYEIKRKRGAPARELSAEEPSAGA